MPLGISLLGVGEGTRGHQQRRELEKPVVGIRVAGLARVARSERAIIIALAATSTLCAPTLAFKCHSPLE